MRITPWIKTLEKNQVFVFGSNYSGNHGKGAALQAQQFGAKKGIGEGLMGQSYGLPTKPYSVRVSLPLAQIKEHVKTFIKFAKERTDLVFLVTEIGCGLAGYKPKEIAPMFKECKDLENVYLPQTFWEILNSITLEDLLDNVTKENIHKETSTGVSIGAEKI